MNIRIFIFQLHNWTHLFNTIALILVWLGSGHQRTEILLKTNAYYRLKRNENKVFSKENKHEDNESEIQAYVWKLSILFYELAQVLNILNIILFWGYWYDDLKRFQDYNHASHKEGEDMNLGRMYFRKIILYWINTLPSFYMIFDFMFTKIVFRFRHLVFSILYGGCFLTVVFLGFHMINENDFPIPKDSYFNSSTAIVIAI